MPPDRVHELVRIDVACRAELDAGGRLVGTAAVFGPEADLGTHVERLDSHMFDEVLRTDDVKALFNHDANYLLGSTAARTLSLRTDRDGLHFAVQLPDTTYARDLAHLVERGDLAGASFAFIPGPDQRYDRNDDGRHRVTHMSARRLLDVSPVTYPAYRDAGGLQLRTERSFGNTRGIPTAPVGIARAQAIRIRAAARGRNHRGRD